jgi:hypothetical protein
MVKKFIFGFSTIVVLLEALLIFYLSYNDFIHLQIFLSNSLMSKASVTVYFKQDSIPPLKELTSRYPNVRFMSQLANTEETQVWGLCGNTDLNDEVTALINGEFFQKKDFFINKRKAVVGNKIYQDESVQKEDGKKHFSFFKQDYEIIASIGVRTNHMLDNTAFVNLDSVDTSTIRKYTIDGASSSYVNAAVQDMQQKYGVEVLTENNNFIERYLFSGSDLQMLTVLVTFFICILMFVLFLFTVHFYHEEIQVKRIIGVCFKRIFLDLLRNILVLIGASTALAVVAYTSLYFIVLKNFHLHFYVIHFLLFAVMICAVMCVMLFLYMILSHKDFYRNGVK